MSKVNKHINRVYLDAARLAKDEMIRLARKILKEHPKYDECIIAMGELFFTTDDDEIEVRDYDGELTYKYFQPLADFIDEWDEIFGLTGEGVRFTADGELNYKW